MSEYDLKKSERGVSQLYPILEAKDGEIIDGFHRQEADKNWKRVRLQHIDTEEKKLIARLVANFHRRQVLVTEKEDWINGLAAIYRKQGLKVGKLRQPNEIIIKIHEVTGLGRTAIRSYLRREYRQEPGSEAHPPRKAASTVIEHNLGQEYVERHREEVLAREKPKIEQEVKAKLLKSPNFQREVIREIQKPKIVTPSEPCPSGVCELPPIIEGKEPVDVIAERIEQFWMDNPQCQCKTCQHYGKCGVIR